MLQAVAAVVGVEACGVAGAVHLHLLVAVQLQHS
jgi:hypothetical protein